MHTTTRPLLHVVGIAAVLVSAGLAVAVSPMWLIVTAALSVVNLVRYIEPTWRTGKVDPVILPLAFINLVIIAGAGAYALTLF